MFLHIIPARDMRATFAGTYKDVISRAKWLQARFSDYRQVLIADDDPDELNAVLSGGDSVEGAIVEYSFNSRIVKRLKQEFPRARVAVRSINWEALQFFDNVTWPHARGLLWVLYAMARYTRKDFQDKKYADCILSINEWEDQKYWRYLPGRATVEWLPYFCPDYLVPQHPVPYGQRKVIACLPHSQKNRISWDLVTRFHRFASEMKRQGSQDEFVITGKLDDWGLPECPDVSYTGFVDDLGAFVGTCKAVVMLSPLGFGFKTTMADALAAGAHVIAHPKLVRRSPETVRPYLIALNTDDLSRMDAVMTLLQQTPKGHELHQDLCGRAGMVMERWFGKTED